MPRENKLISANSLRCAGLRSGVRALLDRSRFDFLFVLVGDGRRWFIPADHVDGVVALRLGGPKYAEFEVERGDPIPGCTVKETPSTIAS